MQKLKKKFVTLLGIFLFSSCAGLPQKPQIEICNHDAPLKEVECYDNQTNEFRTIPIKHTNKYFMFSPDDWGLVLLYIKRLRGRMGNGKVRSELDKVIETSLMHNVLNDKLFIIRD